MFAEFILSESFILRQAQDERRVEGLRKSRSHSLGNKGHEDEAAFLKRIALD